MEKSNKKDHLNLSNNLYIGKILAEGGISHNYVHIFRIYNVLNFHRQIQPQGKKTKEEFIDHKFRPL